MTSVLLAVLAGTLLAVAVPPFPTPLLPFFALAPLGVAVERLSRELGTGSAGRGVAAIRFPPAALRIGMAFGVVHQLLLLHWVPASVALQRPELAWPLYAVLVGVLGLLEAMAVAAMVTLRVRWRVPLPLAMALCWVALEWVRAHAGGFAFPWSGLALGLTSVPAALGLAEWFGEPGLAFWIAAVNGLVALGLVPAQPWRTRFRWILAGLGAVAVGIGWGAWRNARIPLESLARVAVVQPGLSLEQRSDSAVAVDSTWARVSRLVGRIDGVVDLVVLPEVAFPVVLPRDSVRLAALRTLSREVSAPVAVGAFAEDRSGTRYNTAFVTDSTGLLSGRWEKRRLVPGWERTPGWGGGFLDPTGIGIGRPQPPLRIDGVHWGGLICFETLFGRVSGRQRRDGAAAFLLLTNDGWFHGRRARGSAASVQHLAHARIRAVESRAGIVRAANSGISAVVHPTGRVSTTLGVHREGTLVDSVSSGPGPTLFARTGDVLGSSCAVLVLLLLVGPVRRRRA